MNATNLALDALVLAKTRIENEKKTLDEELVTLVRVARTTGCTWNQIGKALSITRQGAYDRFSDKL